MLARSRVLDERLGPDESRIVFEWEDKWTVRRVDRLEDQRREGQLLRHCLRTIKRPDPNTWSLRDPENLPRLTFAVYLVESGADLSEIPLERPIAGKMEFVRAGPALLFVDVKGSLKPERRAQLADFAERADLSGCERFPTSTRARIRTLRPNFNFAYS